jgi:hypothetical protein
MLKIDTWVNRNTASAETASALMVPMAVPAVTQLTRWSTGVASGMPKARGNGALPGKGASVFYEQKSRVRFLKQSSVPEVADGKKYCCFLFALLSGRPDEFVKKSPKL